MYYTIDRFEDKFSVCEKEDGSFVNIERKFIPSEAKEGDILFLKNNVYCIDIEKTNERKKYIDEKFKALW